MSAVLSFPPQPSAAAVVGDLSSVAVLIVDDTPSKRFALKAVLAPLGVSIVEADSGAAALRCVMSRDFAVILLDVRMPRMDGYETARFIRQRRQSELTPIIFVTAHSNDEIDRYAEGAVDFICLPVVPAELRAKVSVFAHIFITAHGLATRARELQVSANQLSVVADSAPIGIFQTDAQNRYVYTNPRWTEITGITAEQAKGQHWDSIMRPEERASLLAQMPDDAPSPAELSHRFEVNLLESATRIAVITSRSIVDRNGAPAGWVGTLADVTAEVGVEAAMSDARDRATEASRLKSDFLANMSHEIRTPMNGVIGMAELLLDTELDSRQRDYAQTVQNSGEALMTIINDILDFSKIEAGMLEVEKIDFDLRATIDDVVDLLARAAQRKQLELIAVVTDTVPLTMSGDPGRIRQVLTNLIGNAIKFTGAGEVKIVATMTEVDEPAPAIRIEVSDTGDGIPSDKLAVIFQPFVQADTSTSRKYGGTGLGLAISGQLVTLMGGDFGVTSELGVGSTFWFTIGVGADVGESTQKHPAPDSGLAGLTILVVDDNATQRGVLSGYLTGWGMAVTTCDSGPAALRTMSEAVREGRPFAAVLIDLYMPGMDGRELIKSIADDPELTSRVLLMTGLSLDLGRSAAAEESGAPVSLSKPIHRHELLACLRLALGSHAAGTAPSRRTDPRSPRVDGVERGWVLLAEDNLINQKVAVAMLSGAGYRVDTVADGAAAVKAAAAHPYDVILMDCQMPELSGYEATSAIRAQEGSGPRVPIIAMTAGARQEDRELCLAHGMDAYVSKPVSKDTLLAMVRSNARLPSEERAQTSER
jgi:two-component system sensor histidine kinase/response regulator